MEYELDFLKALLTTLAVEGCVVFSLIRCLRMGAGFTGGAVLWAGVFPSMATLPYVWFVFPAFISQRYLYIATSEVFAVVTEALIIATMLRLKPTVGLALSLAANAASFLLGILIEMDGQ